MSLITTPIKRPPTSPLIVSARVNEKQAATFNKLGGGAWLRAQLDAINAMKGRRK